MVNERFMMNIVNNAIKTPLKKTKKSKVDSVKKDYSPFELVAISARNIVTYMECAEKGENVSDWVKNALVDFEYLSEDIEKLRAEYSASAKKSKVRKGDAGIYQLQAYFIDAGYGCKIKESDGKTVLMVRDADSPTGTHVTLENGRYTLYMDFVNVGTFDTAEEIINSAYI